MTGARRLAAGARLAVTTLTVVPLAPASTIDRRTAGLAMSLAPLVGAALGAAMAAVGLALSALGAAALVAAVLTVASGAALTRGLHLDGLADTVDGLGSYAGRETALAIMRKPDVGPFGVTALVLVLLAQAGAVAVLLTRAWPAALAAIVSAAAGGRLAIASACRRGVPAARPEGLGALVAGTVHPAVLVVGGLAVAAVSVPACPGRPWQGPLAVSLGVGAAALLQRHARHRLGGITGDVLGACAEAAATVIYVAVSM